MRITRTVGESELRKYLTEDWRSFVELMINTLDDDEESPAFDALNPRLVALAEGREVPGIHGWALPDGHWARALGLDRMWTLTADHVLVPWDPPPGTPRFVPPGNRKQRREAGWRGRRD